MYKKRALILIYLFAVVISYFNFLSCKDVEKHNTETKTIIPEFKNLNDF